MKISAKWMTVGALGVAALVGMGAGAAKHHEGGGGHERPGMRFMKDRLGKAGELAKELNLTDDQKKKMKEAAEPYRETMHGQVKKVMESRQALRAAVTADNASETAIRSAATELGKAAGDAAVTGSKIYAAIKPILTAEQLKKVEDFRKENKDAVDQFLDGVGKD
jgi:Spy/CpxP family protein refolding chaperone